MSAAARHRPAGRWPLVALCAISLAVAAAGVSLYLGRAPDMVRTVPVTVGVSAPPQRALDCPDGAECFFGPSQPATFAAVQTAFPGSRLVDGWRTIIGATGVTVRETVRAELPSGLSITLQARCVFGGSAVAAMTRTEALADAASQLSIVVPGEADGCSVGVVVRAPAGQFLPMAAADGLARTRSLQLG